MVDRFLDPGAGAFTYVRSERDYFARSRFVLCHERMLMLFACLLSTAEPRSRIYRQRIGKR
jgi:hypothetical protein